ncbi:MAG: hypothetical protein HOA84_03330 [Candidatus Jacksonbacteria bacterium]|nr:hypothetical protein [Candidatus Jacksonbacteria bacterium]
MFKKDDHDTPLNKVAIATAALTATPKVDLDHPLYVVALVFGCVLQVRQLTERRTLRTRSVLERHLVEAG